MRTIHVSFRGGPECGAVRVLPYPEPVVRIPIMPTTTCFVSEAGETPEAPTFRFHHYMPTGERDSQKRIIYEYRGEA